MKNFRKVLALVLVIATLFSFAAMANAAPTPAEIKNWLDEDYVKEMDREYYTDDADIDYAEAVHVLSYVGILDGYPEGDDTFSFQPANNIRRNEMAKMIAVLANAGYDVDELYATAADFEDVPADDWAASYIAYCAKTGIVAGRSATTFDPNASVTGLETAKMLLVVLGMDAEQQGYVGADWKVNVLRDAKVMGLLENFNADYNVDAAISREEAANMMLNALMAPCVAGFLSDEVVTFTNALIVDRNKAYDYNKARVDNYATLRDAVAAGDWALYGNVIISDDLLAAILFDLETVTDVDCFGRPGTKWVMNNKAKSVDVAYISDEAEFSEYDTDVEEVMEYLHETSKGQYDYRLWVDGDKKYDGTSYMGLSNYLHNNKLLGKGVIVEIYTTEADAATKNDAIDVVVINTYIAKVIDVNMAKGKVTFGDELGVKIATEVKNKWGFTVADEDETVVLLWQCKTHGVHSVEEIEPVVGTLTRADIDGKGNISFIASGETYEYAHNFGNCLSNNKWAEHLADATPVKGTFNQDALKDWAIYTDKFGFVMTVASVSNTKAEFAVIDGDSWISDDGYKTAEGMKYRTNTCDFIYFEEGAEPTTVETTNYFNETFVQLDAADGKKYNDILAWVEYDEANDEMSLVPANLSTKDIALERGAVKLDTTDAALSNIKVNNDTQFIVRVPDYFAEEAEGEYTYLYFNGIDEIDANYVAEEFQYFVSNQALLKTTDANYIAGMEECGLEGSSRFYSYIFVDAKYAKDVNRAFILNHYKSSVLALDNGKIMGGDMYEAIVNGEEAIVCYGEYNGTQAHQNIANFLSTNGAVLVRSELKLIGYELDGMPVWANVGVSGSSDGNLVNAAVDPQFRIDGDVLTYLDSSSTASTEVYLAEKCDPDCQIWVAMPAKRGGWEAKLLDADEVVNYCADTGYAYLNGWVIDALDDTNRTDGLIDYLLLVVKEA